MPVLDPADGEIFAYIACGNAADIGAAVSAARGVYDGGDGPWGQAPAAERGRLLALLGQEIAANAEELFGGMKHSGYGREKGFEALLGFTALKTIAIGHG